MVEAAVDTRGASRGHIVPPSRPQVIGSQGAALAVRDDGRGCLIVLCFFVPDTHARLPPRPTTGRRTWISVVSDRGSTLSAQA